MASVTCTPQPPSVRFQLLNVEVLDCAVPRAPPRVDPDSLDRSVFDDLANMYDQERTRAFTSACVVYCFGKTATGNSVCLEVKGFQPWLYVQVPTDMTFAQCRRYIHAVLGKIPASVSLERKHHLYGWAPGTDVSESAVYDYARVAFNNVVTMRYGAKLMVGHGKHQIAPQGYSRLIRLDVHEAQVHASHKFTTFYGLRPSGWVEARGVYDAATTHGRASACDHDLCVDVSRQTASLVDVTCELPNTVAPLLIGSVDIECISEKMAFPNASNEHDQIRLIGTTFIRHGEKHPCRRVMQCLGDAAVPVDSDIEVRCYPTEAALLAAWRDLIVLESDPDVLVSYNGAGFDFEYMWDRYTHPCNQPRRGRFMQLGRLFAVRATSIYKKQLQSAALGENELAFFVTQGRIQMDLFQYVKKTYKLNSFALDAVCKHFMPHRACKLRLRLDGWVQDCAATAATAVENAAVNLCNNSVAAREAVKTHVPLLRALALEQIATPVEDERAWLQLNAARKAIVHALPSTANADTVETQLLTPLREALDACGEDNYRKMFRLMNRDAYARGEVARYCQVDCDLVVYLLERLCIVPSVLKMSEVTYTFPDDITNRGQQIKVFNMIARFASSLNYVVNVKDVGWLADAEYQGATVIEPTAGFYNSKIATLDFASLYPSIMRGYNLCPSSLVLDDAVIDALPSLRANGAVFDTYELGGKTWVFQKHQRGILPRILEDLLCARKAKKREMKTWPKDSAQYKLCDAEQLALKVSCNSVYGFTGVAPGKGMMSCMPVAVATTCNGRRMIEETKRFVESRYGKRVLYGDTDSVMVDMGDAPMARVFAEAETMARETSAIFPDTVALEFEKVFYPYLLLKKKHYAGMKYEDNPAEPPVLDAKGIAVVRRDNCPLLREMMKHVLCTVMRDADPQAAYNYVEEKLVAIANGQVDINDLVISKTLRTDYANDKQPHVVVVKKMRARQAFDVPRSGDRVPYVITYGKEPCVYNRAEHPAYVRENKKVKIDLVYYLDKQLRSHLCRIMRPLPVPCMDALFAKVIAKAQSKMLGMQSLDKFFTKTTSSTEHVPMHATANVGLETTKRKRTETPMRQTTLFSFGQGRPDLAAAQKQHASKRKKTGPARAHGERSVLSFIKRR